MAESSSLQRSECNDDDHHRDASLTALPVTVTTSSSNSNRSSSSRTSNSSSDDIDDDNDVDTKNQESMSISSKSRRNGSGSQQRRGRSRRRRQRGPSSFLASSPPLSSLAHRMVASIDDDNKYDNVNDDDDDNDHPSRSKCDDDDDDDDESDDTEAGSIDGLAPIPTLGWLVLFLPFVLLAVALAIAYLGRRRDAVAVAMADTRWNNRDGSNSGGVNGGGMLTDSVSAAPAATLYGLHRPQNTTVWGARSSSSSSTEYLVTETAAEQLANYQAGSALLLSVEIANHAGHAVCQTLGHAPNAPAPVPALDCQKLGPDDTAALQEPGYPSYYPWAYEQTAANVKVVRQFFHMITWRLTHPTGSTHLSDTAWEEPHLVSLLVIRHPLSRMLAYDAKAAELWPAVFAKPSKIKKVNADDVKNQWWAFARSPYTDNFALRALVGDDCCQGAQTSRKQLERAKALIERFSIILDIECLEEGLHAAADVMGLDMPIAGDMNPVYHAAPRDRIYNAEIYEFLKSKNRLDIELYEWARTRSLVPCNTTADV